MAKPLDQVQYDAARQDMEQKAFNNLITVQQMKRQNEKDNIAMNLQMLQLDRDTQQKEADRRARMYENERARNISLSQFMIQQNQLFSQRKFEAIMTLGVTAAGIYLQRFGGGGVAGGIQNVPGPIYPNPIIQRRRGRPPRIPVVAAAADGAIVGGNLGYMANAVIDFASTVFNFHPVAKLVITGASVAYWIYAAYTTMQTEAALNEKYYSEMVNQDFSQYNPYYEYPTPAGSSSASISNKSSNSSNVFKVANDVAASELQETPLEIIRNKYIRNPTVNQAASKSEDLLDNFLEELRKQSSGSQEKLNEYLISRMDFDNLLTQSRTGTFTDRINATAQGLLLNASDGNLLYNSSQGSIIRYIKEHLGPALGMLIGLSIATGFGAYATSKLIYQSGNTHLRKDLGNILAYFGINARGIGSAADKRLKEIEDSEKLAKQMLEDMQQNLNEINRAQSEVARQTRGMNIMPPQQQQQQQQPQRSTTKTTTKRVTFSNRVQNYVIPNTSFTRADFHSDQAVADYVLIAHMMRNHPMGTGGSGTFRQIQPIVRADITSSAFQNQKSLYSQRGTNMQGTLIPTLNAATQSIGKRIQPPYSTQYMQRQMNSIGIEHTFEANRIKRMADGGQQYDNRQDMFGTDGNAGRSSVARFQLNRVTPSALNRGRSLANLEDEQEMLDDEADNILAGKGVMMEPAFNLARAFGTTFGRAFRRSNSLSSRSQSVLGQPMNVNINIQGVGNATDREKERLDQIRRDNAALFEDYDNVQAKSFANILNNINDLGASLFYDAYGTRLQREKAKLLNDYEKLIMAVRQELLSAATAMVTEIKTPMQTIPQNLQAYFDCVRTQVAAVRQIVTTVVDNHRSLNFATPEILSAFADNFGSMDKNQFSKILTVLRQNKIKYLKAASASASASTQKAKIFQQVLSGIRQMAQELDDDTVRVQLLQQCQQMEDESVQSEFANQSFLSENVFGVDALSEKTAQARAEQLLQKEYGEAPIFKDASMNSFGTALHRSVEEARNQTEYNSIQANKSAQQQQDAQNLNMSTGVLPSVRNDLNPRQAINVNQQQMNTIMNEDVLKDDSQVQYDGQVEVLLDRSQLLSVIYADYNQQTMSSSNIMRRIQFMLIVLLRKHQVMNEIFQVYIAQLSALLVLVRKTLTQSSIAGTLRLQDYVLINDGNGQYQPPTTPDEVENAINAFIQYVLENAVPRGHLLTISSLNQSDSGSTYYFFNQMYGKNLISFYVYIYTVAILDSMSIRPGTFMGRTIQASSQADFVSIPSASGLILVNSIVANAVANATQQLRIAPDDTSLTPALYQVLADLIPGNATAIAAASIVSNENATIRSLQQDDFIQQYATAIFFTNVFSELAQYGITFSDVDEDQSNVPTTSTQISMEGLNQVLPQNEYMYVRNVYLASIRKLPIAVFSSVVIASLDNSFQQIYTEKDPTASGPITAEDYVRKGDLKSNDQKSEQQIRVEQNPPIEEEIKQQVENTQRATRSLFNTGRAINIHDRTISAFDQIDLYNNALESAIQNDQ